MRVLARSVPERPFGWHTTCVVDVPHRHQRRGRAYSVRLDIRTPTGETVVTHEHPLAASHQEIDVAVRAAFDTATRQLEDDVRRRRSA